VREILAITTPYFEGIYPIPIGVEGIHEVHVDAASRLQTKLFKFVASATGSELRWAHNIAKTLLTSYGHYA
jgi:hypothetical protein